MLGTHNKHRPVITQPEDPTYRLIALTQGQVTKVSTEDYEWLNGYNWCAVYDKKLRNYYVTRGKRLSEGGPGATRMHVAIVSPDKGYLVDHINRDTLDNRRTNLRQATKSQNQTNTKTPVTNTSGQKGVSFNKVWKKWVVRMHIDGKEQRLGVFASFDDAVNLYHVESIKHHGQFARPS